MSRYFGKPVQMGNIVPDIDAAMQGCIEAGIGPFFVQREHANPARYRGERHDVVFSCAFGYSGDIQVEFIQQLNDAPSAFRDFLSRRPEGGLHHLAYFTDDIDATVAAANRERPRFEIAEEFIFPDGQVHEVYLEPVEEVTGPLAVQLINSNNRESVEFFELMQRQSVGWDGADPVRPLADVLQRFGE